MKFLHHYTGAILRHLQNLAIYRYIGRRMVRGITIHEATGQDLLAVYRWLNPNEEESVCLPPSQNVTNWVAKHCGQLAGFVQLVRITGNDFPSPGYWIFSLYVKAHLQGLGIGERLSQEVINRSRIEDAPTLNLLVYEDNIRAIQLYQKLNFEKHIISEFELQLEKERTIGGYRRIMMRKRIVNHS